jgi:hypothetical protein
VACWVLGDDGDDMDCSAAPSIANDALLEDGERCGEATALDGRSGEATPLDGRSDVEPECSEISSFMESDRPTSD